MNKFDFNRRKKNVECENETKPHDKKKRLYGIKFEDCVDEWKIGNSVIDKANELSIEVRLHVVQGSRYIYSFNKT